MQQNPSTDHLSALHFLVPPNYPNFSDHHFFNNNNNNNNNSNNMIMNNVPNNNFQRSPFSTSPLYNLQFPSHDDLQDINNNIMINNNGPNPNPSYSNIYAGGGQLLPPQASSFSSNNSTSDEADEQQLSLISERKQRRMISNRESARRSRMRKQKHLDELWSQVVWLRSENHQLIDKLNRAAERHDLVAQENAQLKEEATELRQMLSDLHVTSPGGPALTTSFQGLRDQFDNDVMPCNTAYLRAESSNNQSNITTSMDLLG